MKAKKPVLFILDPLKKLDIKTDTSLALLLEFSSRGRGSWIADLSDLEAYSGRIFAHAAQAMVSKSGQITALKPLRRPLSDFSLVIIRKEPPFNEAYITMTYLLELAPPQVFVSNNPAGIRNTNEKMGILRFPKWIPETFVSSSPDLILSFQKKLGRPVVVKPLDKKGGEGVFLLHSGTSHAIKQLRQASEGGIKPLQVQRFLTSNGFRGDKRILLLGGQPLAAFEKVPQKGEFRANLSLGAVTRACGISRKEKLLIRSLAPYLKKQGLHLAGIDVMQERLIEINVTCPSGLLDAKLLYPELEPVKAWADFLERQEQKTLAN